MALQVHNAKFFIKKSDVSARDISAVVSIHRQEISQGFLSSLGPKPLSMFFTFASVSKYGILHVAKSSIDGKVIGFVLGTEDTAKFYKDFILKRSFKAFLLLATKLFSVERIIKLFETLIYPTKSKNIELLNAELLDIAIQEERRGSGLAQSLFYSFSDAIAERDICQFRITTGSSQDRAQRFYEKLGAKKIGELEVHKGQRTCVYRFDVAKL